MNAPGTPGNPLQSRVARPFYLDKPSGKGLVKLTWQLDYVIALAD